MSAPSKSTLHAVVKAIAEDYDGNIPGPWDDEEFVEMLAEHLHDHLESHTGTVKPLTRNEVLAILTSSGYSGPTSFTASKLRELAAWYLALASVASTGFAAYPQVAGRNARDGMTRDECLLALAALGYDGPTSYTARDLRWLVAAVYAETVAETQAVA